MLDPCAARVGHLPNDLVIPMSVTDQAVLNLVQSTMLREDVVIATVAEAVARLRPTDEHSGEWARLEEELARVEDELARLAEAVAEGGQLRTLIEKIRERERQRDRLREELAALADLEHVQHVDLRQLERELREILSEWRALLTKYVQQARQILRKELDGRLRFIPEQDTEGRYYRFEGTGRLEPMLAGVVLPKALVAPTGSDRPWGFVIEDFVPLTT